MLTSLSRSRGQKPQPAWLTMRFFDLSDLLVIVSAGSVLEQELVKAARGGDVLFANLGSDGK